jgi:hypothetical protein
MQTAYDGATCETAASARNTGVWKRRDPHERRWLSVSKVLLEQWYLRSDAASQIRPTLPRSAANDHRRG